MIIEPLAMLHIAYLVDHIDFYSNLLSKTINNRPNNLSYSLDRCQWCIHDYRHI